MPLAAHPTYLYIILYYRTENYTGSFYWALAPSSRKDGPYGPTDVYAIDNPGGTWTKNYTPQQDLCSTSSQQKLLGCVRLPSISAPQSDISSFITQYPAHANPTSGGSGTEPPWSCARWVIHIVGDLVDAGLLPDELAPTRRDDGFYWQVHKLGIGMQGTPKRPGALRVVDYV